MDDFDTKPYAQALVRALSAAGVEFVRFLALDVCNMPRCKMIPLDRIRKSLQFDYQTSTASIVFAGLPSFADAGQPDSGLDAQDQVVVMPDMSTLRILPYSKSSAMVIGNLHDQQTGLLSDLCCRGLLQTLVEQAAEQFNVGVSVGAELEFCLYDASTDKPVDCSNYAYTTTLNRQDAYVEDLYKQLREQEVEVEMIHAESAPGQLEVVLAYQKDPVQLADNVTFARETIREVARKHGLKALFLPKILPMAAGNGCHVHLSLYSLETGENLYVEKKSLSRRRQSFLLGESKDISCIGKSFMEGILHHLPALLALTLPTANSFRRVGPGCWTGSEVTWAFEDKESPLRVVANLQSQSWDHFEVKLCDSMANLYLALSGILIAGLNGIANNLELRPSRHDDGAGESIQSLPATLEDSLQLLVDDVLLMEGLPTTMMRGYVALRRAEAARAAEMTLDDEVREALERA